MSLNDMVERANGAVGQKAHREGGSFAGEESPGSLQRTIVDGQPTRGFRVVISTHFTRGAQRAGRPYAETEEFVNVGVLVSCLQPCLFDFEAEPAMPERGRALFPKHNEQAFAAALGALEREMIRLRGDALDPKAVQIAFNETVRIRESVFRFGDVRTILTENPEDLAHELFVRYVRMQEPAPTEADLAKS